MILLDKSLELETLWVSERGVGFAAVVSSHADIVIPVAEAIFVDRNVDVTERLGDGHLRGQPANASSIVLLGSGENVLVLLNLRLFLDRPIHKYVSINVASLIFTEDLLGLERNEVGSDPLHPAHEHGDSEEEDHPSLPRSKLSNSFEDIFVEQLHFYQKSFTS